MRKKMNEMQATSNTDYSVIVYENLGEKVVPYSWVFKLEHDDESGTYNT